MEEQLVKITAGIMQQLGADKYSTFKRKAVELLVIATAVPLIVYLMGRNRK